MLYRLIRAMARLISTDKVTSLVLKEGCGTCISPLSYRVVDSECFGGSVQAPLKISK